MIPRAERNLRRIRGVFLLFWLALVFSVTTILYLTPEEMQHQYGFTVLQPPPPPIEELHLEWMVVNADNVLLWPVVDGECQRRKALAQYNNGDEVLVIYRYGEFIEVVSNDQTRLNRHGCVHESLLSPLRTEVLTDDK